MSKLQRIGIFSGTFDPIHDGHVEFAKQVLKKGKLDKVYFMVERNPRRKQGVRAFEHRQAMVQLAIEDESALGSIITQQQRFTPHHTLPLLKKRFGSDVQLVLLVGDDMLTHMHEWPHVDELLRAVEFAIGVRSSETKKAEERIKLIEQTKSVKFRHEFFEDGPHRAVSSSQVRMQLRRQEEPQNIHAKVAHYIKNEGLYSPSSEDSAKN